MIVDFRFKSLESWVTASSEIYIYEYITFLESILGWVDEVKVQIVQKEVYG